MSRRHTQPSSLPSTRLVSLNPPVLKRLLHVSPAKCFPLVLAKELGSVSQANRKWLQDYAQTAQKGKTNMQQKRTNTKQKGYTGPPTVPTWWCKALVNGIRSQSAYKKHSSIMEFYHGSIIYKLRNFQWMNNTSSARKILFYSTLQNIYNVQYIEVHHVPWKLLKGSVNVNSLAADAAFSHLSHTCHGRHLFIGMALIRAKKCSASCFPDCPSSH